MTPRERGREMARAPRDWPTLIARAVATPQSIHTWPLQVNSREVIKTSRSSLVLGHAFWPVELRERHWGYHWKSVFSLVAVPSTCRGDPGLLTILLLQSRR